MLIPHLKSSSRTDVVLNIKYSYKLLLCTLNYLVVMKPFFFVFKTPENNSKVLVSRTHRFPHLNSNHTSFKIRKIKLGNSGCFIWHVEVLENTVLMMQNCWFVGQEVFSLRLVIYVIGSLTVWMLMDRRWSSVLAQNWELNRVSYLIYLNGVFVMNWHFSADLRLQLKCSKRSLNTDLM